MLIALMPARRFLSPYATLDATIDAMLLRHYAMLIAAFRYFLSAVSEEIAPLFFIRYFATPPPLSFRHTPLLL